MFTNKDIVMAPSPTSPTPLAPTNALMWYNDPTNGMQCWRHGKASGATVAGLVYKCAHTTTSDLVTVTAAANHGRAELIGVAQHVIADGSYGWWLCYGVGSVTAESEIAAGGKFGTEGSAGKVGDASGTGGCEIGRAHNSAVIAAGATGTAFINCL